MTNIVPHAACGSQHRARTHRRASSDPRRVAGARHPETGDLHEMTTHDVEKSADDFKIYDSETMAEPNEFWTLLRETAPAHRVDEGLGYTLVSRYADVQNLLLDPDTFRNGVSRHFAKGSPHPDSPAVAAVMADAAPYQI